MAPWHPLGAPMPLMPYTPSGPWVPRVPVSPNTPLIPLHSWCLLHPLGGPNAPYTPSGFQLLSLSNWPSSCSSNAHFLLASFPIVVTLQLTCLHAVQMLIFYCCHFQLLSLCNWPSTGVCPLYNIPSLGVKGTSAVPWSSVNFCSISQNMHNKVPVASLHWKTKQVVWTWKDEWPPRRTSTYERPFTREGNYLVSVVAAAVD